MKGFLNKMESILKLKIWPGDNTERFEKQIKKTVAESVEMSNQIHKMKATIDTEDGWCLKIVKTGDENDCINSG